MKKGTIALNSAKNLIQRFHEYGLYDGCYNGIVTKYVHIEADEKLRTVHLTAVPGITVAEGQRRTLLPAETLAADTTDHMGTVTFRDGAPSRVDFGGGYCTVSSTGGNEPQSHIDFHYYTQDHLGNIREVVAEDGTLEQVTDYYPFGTPYSDNTGRNPSFQPYKFGAKELDLTHGYIAYDFGARRYNSLLCTWDRIDPMCEKYNDMSPYAYCGDNPINAIDKEGRLIVFINGFNVGDGGKSAYWEGFDNAIRQHFNENRASLYYDGSIGGPFGLSPTTIGNQISLNYHTEKLRPSSYYAGTRYEMGYESGKFAVKAICVIRPNPVHFPGALQGSSEV